MEELDRLRREASIGDVLDHLKQTKRPQLADRVMRREEELARLNGQEIPEESKTLRRHSKLRGVLYAEVTELVKFVEGCTPFATQHSVKGAEFENVLVNLGGGWNHYNWPKQLELLETKALNAKNTKGYYRARNLFYVSNSRPSGKRRPASRSERPLSTRCSIPNPLSLIGRSDRVHALSKVAYKKSQTLS